MSKRPHDQVAKQELPAVEPAVAESLDAEMELLRDLSVARDVAISRGLNNAAIQRAIRYAVERIEGK